MKESLSLEEAKHESIHNGKKIRHLYFPEGEYIFCENNIWYNEDDYLLPKSYFLSMDDEWNDGWSVVE